jgi:secreted trypsin-like serine protease
MRRRSTLALLALISLGPPAGAMVGGAEVVRGTGAGRHIVMIISTRGSLCTGTAIARDLVLTGGHCVAPAATYRVLLPDIKPPGLAVRRIVVHPSYSAKDYASGRVTADVALIKLEQPLPADIVPAAVAPVTSVAPGDRFVIAGYGGTAPGSDAGNGVPRAAALVATGKPGTLQIRLVDPATREQRPGLGACTGDSGGPAFVEMNGALAVIGVVSWSTGAASTAGCGGLTGVTPLALHRGWVVEQAKKMESAIEP